VVREKDEENSKKPQNESVEAIVKRVLAVQQAPSKGSEKSTGLGSATNSTVTRGTNSGEGSNRKAEGLTCWHCKEEGH
jgi:hypothetical protein